MLDFTDQVVLITGAGAGIGSGMAKAFHDAGARVALGDFRETAIARTAARLGSSSRVYTRTVDVRDARSTAEFLESAEGALGPVTVAVANAGIYPNTPVLEMAKHRINVNCISPGLIEVEGEVSPLTPEYVATLTRSIPWGRIGKPEDIANAALFLASPLADFITGEVLAVNGGSSAGRAFP